MWQRLLFLGVDILGLVFAGVAAKGAKVAVKGAVSGLRTAEEVAVVVGKNSTFKSILTRIGEALSKVPGKLSEAASYLGSKFPAGANFIKGIVGKIGKFIKSISEFISKALNTVIPGSSKLAKGTRTGIATTALVGGIGTYHNYKQEKEMEKMSGILSDTKDIKIDFSQGL
jgi:phage-related protein